MQVHWCSSGYRCASECVSIMPVCVSMCQFMSVQVCRYVSVCVRMCHYMSACASNQHVSVYVIICQLYCMCHYVSVCVSIICFNRHRGCFDSCTRHASALNGNYIETISQHSGWDAEYRKGRLEWKRKWGRLEAPWTTVSRPFMRDGLTDVNSDNSK